MSFMDSFENSKDYFSKSLPMLLTGFKPLSTPLSTEKSYLCG